MRLCGRWADVIRLGTEDTEANPSPTYCCECTFPRVDCEAKESYLTFIIPDAKHDGYYTTSFLLSCTIPLFIRPEGISLNAAYSSEIHTSVRWKKDNSRRVVWTNMAGYLCPILPEAYDGYCLVPKPYLNNPHSLVMSRVHWRAGQHLHPP